MFDSRALKMGKPVMPATSLGLSAKMGSKQALLTASLPDQLAPLMRLPDSVDRCRWLHLTPDIAAGAGRRSAVGVDLKPIMYNDCCAQRHGTLSTLIRLCRVQLTHM